MFNDRKGISVIICCYNSAATIAETLHHLAKQKFSNPWEIILVDNLSNDNTSTIARNEWNKYELPNIDFIVTEQAKPGLNFAREKGVEAARYEYLIFCDDDNWLKDDYLSTAFQLITNNASIGAIGGECIAVKDPHVVVPDWFEEFKNNYAVGKQADHTGDITNRGYLWGAGLVTKKTVFNKCITKEFPYLLTDRIGNSLNSGGDTELCSRIILAGYSLYYSEGLILYHYIPPSRLTLYYFNKLIEGIDAAHIELSKYYYLININSLTQNKKILNTLKCIVKILFSPIIKKAILKTEKQLLFLYTGIDLGVETNLRMLKKFNNGFIRRTS